MSERIRIEPHRKQACTVKNIRFFIKRTNPFLIHISFYFENEELCLKLFFLLSVNKDKLYEQINRLF